MAETILVVGFQFHYVWDLLKADYQVRYAAEDSAIRIVSTETPSVTLLSQDSDKVTDLCISLRRVAPKMPLIIIGRANDMDRMLRLFKADADDYIRDPLDPNELIARIRSALRRSATSNREMTEQKAILASEISAVRSAIKKLRNKS